MLSPRYRVRVKTTEGIETYPAKTKAEAQEIFSQHCREAPATRLEVQMQDSDRERSTFTLVKWCDLTSSANTYR